MLETGAGKAGQKSLEGTPSQGQRYVMNPVDHPTVVVKVGADGRPGPGSLP